VAGKKTDAGKDRIVPIPSQVLDIVLERAWIPGTELLFPMYHFSRKKEPDLIRFKPMTDDYLNKSVFKPMAATLGIADGKVPYSARHSYADMLKDASGSDKSKAALIGHSTYLFTQTHYQSDTVEELAKIVSSFE
jgi:integrase